MIQQQDIWLSSGRAISQTKFLLAKYAKRDWEILEFNIDHRLTTSYNPTSNGKTEWFNRTLTTMLRKELVDKPHGNWEEVLEYLSFPYRTTVHTSTNETPFFLLHGRDPALPVNQILSATPTYAPAYDHVSTLMERLAYSFRRVAEMNTVVRERKRINMINGQNLLLHDRRSSPTGCPYNSTRRK